MSARTYSNGIEALALEVSQFSDRWCRALWCMQDQLASYPDAHYCLDAPEEIPVGSVRQGTHHNVTFVHVQHRGIW